MAKDKNGKVFEVGQTVDVDSKGETPWSVFEPYNGMGIVRELHEEGPHAYSTLDGREDSGSRMIAPGAQTSASSRASGRTSRWWRSAKNSTRFPKKEDDDDAQD